MRKAIVLSITAAIVSLMFATSVFAKTQNEISCEDTEQVLLRLLYAPAQEAIAEYYGEPRQYWEGKILSVQKGAPYYEVVMQVETFYGPHNPPYGIETMTFGIAAGKVKLQKFEHQDEPNQNSKVGE